MADVFKVKWIRVLWLRGTCNFALLGGWSRVVLVVWIEKKNEATNSHSHMHMHTHARTHTHTHAHTRTHTHTHKHANALLYIHTYIAYHIYTHTCTQLSHCTNADMCTCTQYLRECAELAVHCSPPPLPPFCS